MFYENIMQAQTLAQGQPWYPWSPVASAPGGIMGQMMLGAMSQYVGQQYGAVPMGVGYQGNINNVLAQQMFTQAHYAAMAEASKVDKELMMNTARGFASRFNIPTDTISTAGQNWNRDMSRYTENLMSIAPYLPPGWLDTMTGGRSSIALTHSTHLGGRYREDIRTGRMGMSAASSAAMSADLYNYYYHSSLDKAEMLKRTVGVTSGEMGDIYSELVMRGQMAGPGTRADRIKLALADLSPDLTAKAFEAAGIDSSSLGNYRGRKGVIDLDKLTDKQLGTLSKDVNVDRQMEINDARRVKGTLDKYLGAYAAIKEVFGENGLDTTDHKKLWGALETLSMGSTQQMDEGRLEMLVRNLHGAAKKAGIGLEAMMMVMREAGQFAKDTGMNPLFAVQAANEAFAFRATISRTGLLANPAWGQMSGDQLMMMQMSSMQRAQGSQLSNRMGALIRVAENYGDDALTPEGKSLLQQIRAGHVPDKFVTMTAGEFTQSVIGRGTKVTQSEFDRMLMNVTGNEELIYKRGLGYLAHQAQAVEFRERVLGPVGGAFGEVAFSAVRSKFGRGFGNVAGMISEAAAKSLMGMSKENRADTNTRFTTMADDIMQDLEARAKTDPQVARFLSSMPRKDLIKQLRGISEEGYFTAERYGQEQGMIGRGERLVNYLNMFDKDIMAAYGKTRTEVIGGELMNSVVAGYNQDSLVRRALTAIQEEGRIAAGKGKTKDFTTLVGEVLGLAPKSEIAAHLGREMEALGKMRKEAEAEVGKMIEAGVPEPEAKAAAKAKVEAIMTKQAEIESYIKANDLDEKISKKLAEQAEQSKEDAKMIKLDVASISLNGEVVMKNAKSDTVKATDKSSGAPVAGH